MRGGAGIAPLLQAGLRMLLLIALGLGLAGPAPSAAAELPTVRIHFHRDSNDYVGWGMYIWGTGLALPHAVSWDRPLQPTGVDAFGIYFDVPVEPHVATFSFIVHKGENKSVAQDLAVDIPRHGREIWLFENSDRIHTSAPAVTQPFQLGLEAEQRRRATLQWTAAGVAGGLLLVALAWRVVRRRLASTREQLNAQVKMLVQAQNELRAQGERLQGNVVDELTGLPTRGGLHQALEQALGRCARHGQCLAVMFVDLDGFKQVNDSAGHDAGDAVLRAVSRRLRGVLRDGDVVARIGGDEFVAVVEALHSPLHAFKVGRKLVRAAAEPVEVEGRRHQVGASVGIALYPGDGSDAATLLKAADAAMYDTKRSGKGACRFVDAQRQAELEHRLALEQELSAALERQALQLHQEPVIELATGRITGRIATLGWQVDGVLQPVQGVLESADDPAFIAALDRWLLTHACRAAAAPTSATLDRPPFVAVALGCALSDSEPLPALVRDVLAEEGLPPQRLMLLFPSRWLADPKRPLDVLMRLRAQGVKIGFTRASEVEIGLQRLITAPIDLLQLDVGARANAPGGTAHIRALAAVGAQCGFSVAAAGITHGAHLQWAQAAGCTLGSGPACRGPMPTTIAAAPASSPHP